MREMRYDDTDHLTDSVTDEEVRKALEDARNRGVEIHKPGSTITRSNGRTYRVNKLGQWVRVTP